MVGTGIQYSEEDINSHLSAQGLNWWDLCGGCHQWGASPKFDDSGKCFGCGRTERQIMDCHGIVYIKDIVV